MRGFSLQSILTYQGIIRFPSLFPINAIQLIWWWAFGKISGNSLGFRMTIMGFI